MNPIRHVRVFIEVWLVNFYPPWCQPVALTMQSKTVKKCFHCLYLSGKLFSLSSCPILTFPCLSTAPWHSAYAALKSFRSAYSKSCPCYGWGIKNQRKVTGEIKLQVATEIVARKYVLIILCYCSNFIFKLYFSSVSCTINPIFD